MQYFVGEQNLKRRNSAVMKGKMWERQKKMFKEMKYLFVELHTTHEKISRKCK